MDAVYALAVIGGVLLVVSALGALVGRLIWAGTEDEALPPRRPSVDELLERMDWRWP